MKKILLIPIIFGALIFSALIVSADDKGEAAAVKSSQAWLELLDQGKYGDCWQISAQSFKSQVGKDQWEKEAKEYRGPLGKPIERKLKSTRYTRTLPQAVEADYYVIKFETVFEDKQTVVETLIPMLEKDGQWRVSGYDFK